jgi:Domain of unknown function (DUF222)/HNH endonuclease
MKYRKLVNRLDQVLDAPRGTIVHLPDDELGERLLGLAEAAERLHAELVHTVGEFDRRGLAARSSNLSTKAWLVRMCRWSKGKASRIVAQARSLVDMPGTLVAARDGAVTAEAVQMLTACHVRNREAYASHEGVLADVASYLDIDELRQAINLFEQQVNTSQLIDSARNRELNANVYLSRTLDGMWRLDGWLDPERGAIVDEAIRSHVDPTLIDSSDRRTMAQRRADALADICNYTLTHDADLVTSGGERPHLTVTVDYEALADVTGPLPDIDGVVVDPAALRRIACDAGVVRIITDGESQPIDVGRRTRTIPPATRRAVEHLHRTCGWTGCDRPTRWCDIHHIEHWADGGRTDLDNLVPLCRYHHGIVHRGHPPPTGRWDGRRGRPSGGARQRAA